MSILTHRSLDNMVGTFIKSGRESAVSGTSIDIHLGRKILIESPTVRPRIVDYRARQQLEMFEVELDGDGYYDLEPGEFILAHSVEVLDVPAHLSALLRSKSSMGRIGFEHADAGWVDPGFRGALTFEFCNITRHHSIRLRAGDAVGQLIFFEHPCVEPEMLYSKRGRYGGSLTVEQTRPHPKDMTWPADF